jgi:hypothetical protein
MAAAMSKGSDPDGSKDWRLHFLELQAFPLESCSLFTTSKIARLAPEWTAFRSLQTGLCF